MKTFEISLTVDEIRMLKKALTLWQKTIDIYEQHPDMEITIKTYKKRWWKR